MSIAGRLLATIWPVRVWRTLRELCRGVRLHPAALVLGGSRVSLGRGTTVGPRCRFHAMTGGSIDVGSNCWFDSDVDLQTDATLIIGEGSTIQRRCSVQGQSRLGRGSILAPNVFVSSGTHPFREVPHLPIREQEALVANDARRRGELQRAVWIQDDCWLGTNVVVGPGVTIGKGSVIGANSVVLRDVMPYTVVAGAPAKVVGKRLDWIPPTEISAARPEDQVYLLAGARSASGPAGTVGWRAAAGDPIQLALKRSSTAIVEYVATGRAQVRVNGAEHELGSGRGLLEVALDEQCQMFDASLIRIESESTASSDPRCVFVAVRAVD